MMGTRRGTKPADIAAQSLQSAGEVRRKAEGQAAMMLIESVLLALIDRGILTKAEVQELIETVIETKRNIAADGSSVEVENAAAGLLVNLANSLMASSVPKRLDGPA